MYYKIDESILTLIKNGSYQDALDRLNEISVHDIRVTRYLNTRKAKLAADLGKFFLADFYLMLAKENLSKTTTQYYQILNEEAKIALQSKDYERVFSCCNEAIKAKQTNNGVIYLTLGHAYEELGKYLEAYTNYRAAATKTASVGVKQAGLFSLAVLEYHVGNFESSEKYIKTLIDLEGSIGDKTFIVLACCYFRQGRYEELEQLLADVKLSNPDMVYEELYVIVAKKLGKPLPRSHSSRYSMQQLVNYQSQAAIEHIKCNHQSPLATRSVFASEINIEQLFDDIQVQLTDANVEYDDLRDVYDVAYANAGYDIEGNILHHIRVVTIPGTKDIITMYPSDVPIIKIKNQTHLLETKKPLTRIERFNERLAKKTKKE